MLIYPTFYVREDLENNSVLVFVREVQEIGERHGFLRAWLRKF